MDMAEGSSTVGQEPGPSNILAALNTLLLSSSPKSSAYAHPFAPAQNYGSWKGKAKESSHGVELEEQKKLLEQLGQGIASATAIIGRAAREEGKTKLGRGMKEVVTHQSALLPLLPSFTPDSSCPPSFRQPVAPIQLLEAIAQRLGIETYLEESQFGLLKTTLAIAGKRFVLDVDLEVDSAGVEEDEAVNTDPRRGKVRLAKLLVNHVTKDGGTASSDYIASFLKELLEEYLEYWNGERDQEEGERVIKRLWNELGDLAGLDSMAESGRDWFAELERMAARVKGLGNARGTILPSFAFKDGPSFRFRPATSGENIVDPLASQHGRCDWILEYVPDIQSGLVVRRNWLDDTRVQDLETDVKAEALLYGETSPYSGTFVHQRPSGLEQQWSMVTSGPSGYVIGRCGVRNDLQGLQPLLQALKRQANLNTMITSVLCRGNLRTEEEAEDVALDMLSKPSTILPVTITLEHELVHASMALPHSTQIMAPTLKLTFHPSTVSGIDISWALEPADQSLSERIQKAVNRACGQGFDVVEAIRTIEAALAE